MQDHVFINAIKFIRVADIMVIDMNARVKCFSFMRIYVFFSLFFEVGEKCQSIGSRRSLLVGGIYACWNMIIMHRAPE